MTVGRDSEIIWENQTSSGRNAPQPHKPIGFLFRELQFPEGLTLSSGTGIVPEISFTLIEGDAVTIEIEEIDNLSREAGKVSAKYGEIYVP